MNVLLTGSAGFIGYHVAQNLLERGDTVFGIDNFNDYYDVSLKENRNSNLNNYDKFKLFKISIDKIDDLENIFSKNKIDIICHLAAQAGVRYSLENPFAYVNANLVGFQNIIELARRYEVMRLVYASSSSVYGGNKEIPFKVEHRTDSPISLYAATKKANELVAYSYHHLFNMSCTGLRYFTVYGPWGRPDMALFKFTKNILNGNPIDVYNNGNMMRNFTYIDDVVAGTIAAIDNDLNYKVLNIGNDKSVNLMDFITEIEKALKKKAIINFMPLQPGDVPNTIADISETRSLLGFDPKTDIELGVLKFIEWYKKYYSDSISL